ncbi:MAG: HD domain-containing protein [Armatimonadetes bacterium]|nr:HD domain-containing protein [Armatimonadota bacterium]
MPSPRSIVLRDAVHGDLTFTPGEVRVMDTPEIQRLRGIKQLGTASLVYPTAVHTRFDHSLGTCHLTGRIIEAINAHPDTERKVSEEEARLLRLAALIHDVTHVPFGHTFEDERRLFSRHDEGPRLNAYLDSAESKLAGVLDDLGIREPLLRLLSPRSYVPDIQALPRLAPTLNMGPWAWDLIGGTICADLLDYIRRDLFFTGFRQDYDDRIFRSFLIHKGRLALNLTKRGLLRNDTLSEVMNLLRLRYGLTERVYYHHAKSASGAMISKAVECARGLTEDALLGLTDYELWGVLEREHASPITSRMIERLRSRRLYKRVYLLTIEVARARRMQAALVRDYHLSAETRSETERELADSCGLPEGAVLIYCPSDRMALKEAAVPVSLPDEPAIALNDPRADHPAKMELEALQERYLRLWRFTVLLDPEHLDRAADVEAACERKFGERNELRAV